MPSRRKSKGRYGPARVTMFMIARVADVDPGKAYAMMMAGEAFTDATNGKPFTVTEPYIVHTDDAETWDRLIRFEDEKLEPPSERDDTVVLGDSTQPTVEKRALKSRARQDMWITTDTGLDWMNVSVLEGLAPEFRSMKSMPITPPLLSPNGWTLATSTQAYLHALSCCDSPYHVDLIRGKHSMSSSTCIKHGKKTAQVAGVHAKRLEAIMSEAGVDFSYLRGNNGRKILCLGAVPEGAKPFYDNQ